MRRAFRFTLLRCFFLFGLAAPVPLSAQDVPPEVLLSLQSVRDRYVEETSKLQAVETEARARLHRDYLAALLRLESLARTERNLDEILALRREIERVEQQQEETPSSSQEVHRLREILNRQLMEIENRREQSVGELTARVYAYAEQMKTQSIEAGEIDKAVAWREWQTSLEDKLPPPTAEGPAPPGQRPYLLTLWNQHNGHFANWGADRVRITAYAERRKVWENRDLQLAWKPDDDAKTEIEIPVNHLDRLRIEILSWHQHGAGLAEVEITRNGKPVSDQWQVEVSSMFDERFPGGRVVDGNRSGSTYGVGYWLAKPDSRAWLELRLPRAP